MSFRLRRKSRTQADVQVDGGTLKQTTFKGGINLDRPASEISPDQVVDAENVIFFEKHIEARPGTQAMGFSTHAFNANFTGTYHSFTQNTNSLEDASGHRQWYLHRGSRLWSLTNPGADRFELSYIGSGATLGVDADSIIRSSTNGSILFTKSGLFFIPSRAGEGGFFQMNAPNPVFGIKDDTGPAANFVRRYVITLSRIIDLTSRSVTTDRYTANSLLEHESGTNGKAFYNAGNQTRQVDYATRNKATAFSSGSGITFSNAELKALFSSTSSPTDNSAAAHFTHVSIYATLDQGPTGNDPVTGQGNNGQEFVWVADVKRDDVFGSGATFTDNIDDKTLQDRLGADGFLVKTRGFLPMPNGSVGEVTNAYIFVANRESSGSRSTVSYCQLASPETMGYYFPGSQSKIFKDTVMALRAAGDILSIFCLNSTHTCTLTSSNDTASQLVEVSTLDHWTMVDDAIGVRDWGTISNVDKNSFIAVCSDATVRIWDTTKWGSDISYDAVNTEIRKIVPADQSNVTTGSVGVFYRGAYYLWYSKNSTDTCLSNVLRYAFGSRTILNQSPGVGLPATFGSPAGFGWTRYTNWITLPFRCGACVTLDDINRIQRLVGISATAYSNSAYTDTLYWLETYDTYAGAADYTAPLSRQNVEARAVGIDFGARSGDEIACRILFREMTAAEESNTLIHEESHLYFRPMVKADGYRSALQINMKCYADDVVAPVEEVFNLPKTGDLHFTKELSGSRIQVEVLTTAAQFRIVAIDSHCRSLDRVNYATAGDNPSSENTLSDAQHQQALASNLVHWMTRRELVNRATGYKLVPTNTPVKTTGPDGVANSAFAFGASSLYHSDTRPNLDGSFTILMAVKFTFNSSSPPIVHGGGGDQGLDIAFPTATSISFSGLGSVAIPTVNNNAWRLFRFVRHFDPLSDGSSINIYDGLTLVGTLDGNDIIGLNTLYFGNAANVNIYDLRIYNTDIAESTQEYWYNDIIGNAGNNVCPMI